MRCQKGSSGAQLRAATTTPDPRTSRHTTAMPPPLSQSKLRGWVVSGGKCNAGSKLKVNFSFHGRAFVRRIIRSSFRAKSRRISAREIRSPSPPSSSSFTFFADYTIRRSDLLVFTCHCSCERPRLAYHSLGLTSPVNCARTRLVPQFPMRYADNRNLRKRGYCYVPGRHGRLRTWTLLCTIGQCV